MLNIPILDPALPRLPQPLAPLAGLAANLYWTWNPEIESLFADIDARKWAEGAGPLRILREARNLDDLAYNSSFVARVRAAGGQLDDYLAAEPRAWQSRQASRRTHPIAYFCAEYAFHTTLNQYAGGLGILAGDHCKEASDMALPFVGVGLFYRRGFFRQMIDWEGRQEHLYPVYDPSDYLTLVAQPGTSTPLDVAVPFPGRTVHAAVWLARVGRAPLLLLDTDLPQNAAENRAITSQLYTNGREMRLYQETVLGVGGVRALRALGIEPAAWHLNEGHSAFLLLERLREQVAAGRGVEESRRAIAADAAITIHTPVPEGNERFDAELAARLLGPVVEGTALQPGDVLKWGLGADGDPGVFDMTAFALRHCTAANGVSLLHGRTANATWESIAGYPVTGVTNGVHMPTWVGRPMRAVFESCGARFDGSDIASVPSAAGGRPVWDAIRASDDRALWDAHLAQKKELLAFARQRLYAQHARHGDGPSSLHRLLDALNPDAFVIGFARRFATYKRASLLFSDEERLARLLNDPQRPVQIVFSGKSHPSDRGGQSLIAQVFDKSRHSSFEGKVFVLEDYDMTVGRHLVQGADMWLNNPRRPLEASGTSGMKAAANGLPNVSILDGWWDEAYAESPRNGWAIGTRDVLDDVLEQDRLDALSLYEVLEGEVIPAYFDRDAAGLPFRWLPVMKEAIATSLLAFSTRRMLEDYVSHLLPGA